MKEYRKKFTLIELIVVISTIAILSAIIIPNISEVKQKGLVAAVQSNQVSLQTGTDLYMIEHNGMKPSVIQPEISTPQPVSLETLYPDYIRNLNPNENSKYWVDYWGNVWASTLDAPTNIVNDNGTLKWKSVEGAQSYEIYQVKEENKTSKANLSALLFVAKTADIQYSVDKDKKYVVNSISQAGLKSVPVGEGYVGFEKENPSVQNPIPTPAPIEVIPPSIPNEFVNTSPFLMLGSSTTIQWNPTTNWGSKNTNNKYRLEVQYNAEPWTLISDASASTQIPYTISNNVNYKTLSYRVRAENDGGYSEWKQSIVYNLIVNNATTPTNMTSYRNNVGSIYAFKITGSLSGSVWGTDVYTDDSTLSKAAVHSGKLAPGETKVLYVKMIKGQTSYGGSTKNGVTSSNYGTWPASYSFISSP